MTHAAYRRMGHEHHYAVIFWDTFGPVVTRVLMLVPAVAALMFMWMRVPHLYLGAGALALAGLVGVGWLVYQNSQVALSRRMNARAAGRAPRGPGLGWAVGGVVALLAGAGWAALWSPWA